MKSSIATQIEGALLMLDDATPHVAVRVQAIRDEEVIATTLSDGGGRYQFMDLMPGRYQLRCQVLGGYVYYRATDRALRFTFYGSETNDLGDILHIQPGKTFHNIDFRFAPFKKGTWKNCTQFDGLAHNRVRFIYRTPDGILWFGTVGGGLSRYDGKGFINLTPKDGLAHNEVWTILGDTDGVMWFGTRGGVSRYDGKEFTNLTIEDGLIHNFAITMYRAPDGIMWFGTEGGLSRYDGKEFVNLTTEDGLAHNSVIVIYRDPDGVMWFGTYGGGVSRYDGEGFVNFTTEDGLTDNNVIAVERDLNGAMWFATNGGVSRYNGESFINFTTEDGLAHNQVWAMHRDSDGVMWFGTYGGGVSRYDGESFVNFTAEDGLAHNQVWAIYSDSDGVMWFGTEDGLSRYDRKWIVNFTTKDGLVGNGINSLYSHPDGVVWIGTWQGICRYDGRAFTSFTTENGLPHNVINAIHCDPDGTAWFATEGGISRYDGKEFVNFTREDGLADNSVRAIHRDPDGVLWLGTRGGISRYDGEDFISFTTKDGLPDNSIMAIHRDPDGTLWFGMWNGGGISRYDGKGFVNFGPEDGLTNSWISAIHRASDGRMWVGASIGAFYHDGEGDAKFVVEDTLAHNWIRAIYQDLDGTLWFATRYNGIFCYNGAQWTSLDVRDGLAGNDVRSICRDADGSLWFGTSQGITRYRPGPTRPGIRILSITTDQTYRFKTQYAGGKTEEPSVPAFTIGTRVTIEYDSIDFKTIPEKRQYRCRVYETGDVRHETSRRGDLDSTISSLKSDAPYLPPTKSTTFDRRETSGRGDLDSTVSRLKSDVPYSPSTEDTTFDWTPEKPGTYVFEVQAIDRDLNYSEPASVELKVIPDPRNHRIIQLEEHIHQQELAELERVHRELEDARQIQQSLLPEQPPRIEGFEIAGASLPAREVSGDFYDYLALGENTGIALADVTGKSVKAAMIAAMANGMLHAEVRERVDVWDSPGMILRQLNTGLRPRLSRGMFTAMSLGILQVAGKRLLFSNAGMMYPIVKRGERVWELKVNGMPLGLIERAEYQDLSLDLKRGDLVVFYSDGIIEAENEAGEMYQTERLLELMQRADPGLSAQDMVDLIVRDVTAFVGDEESSDDITIVVLRYKE